MTPPANARRHAFAQLILARVREFYREPEVLFWVYGFPLILATVLGLAFSKSEPTPPTVDVVDKARDKRAEAIMEVLKNAKMTVALNSEDISRQRFKNDKIAMIVMVENKKELDYLFDPAKDKSQLARYWVDSVLVRSGEPWGVSPRVNASINEVILTEPGTRYIDFLLPGLIGMNIMGGGLFGVGFVLVDMRVRKLFKRLLATPMHRGDFLFALLSARMFFLLPEMLSLILVGWFAFSVPVQGSMLTLLLVILLGAFAFSGIGLLLGCRTEKTESIQGLINLVMLPMYLLSGIFFSSDRFPEALQPLIKALPLTQLIDALRAVMLDGAGLLDIAGSLGILAAWAVVTFALAPALVPLEVGRFSHHFKSRGAPFSVLRDFGNAKQIPTIRKDYFFFIFLIIMLAWQNDGCMILSVPLVEDFGDWATPKPLTAGHFFPPLLLPSDDHGRISAVGRGNCRAHAPAPVQTLVS